MEIIFTNCTYNHISRALSLADTIKKYTPKYKLVICLIGKLTEKVSIPENCELIEVEQFEIPFLKEMVFKYDTLELNSALKPFLAYSILEKYNPDKVIYLDSDIILYRDFDYLNKILEDKSVVLSPHSLSSISDGKGVDDRNFLRSGIFNAGFFLVKNDAQAKEFLNWWRTNLKDKCYFDPKKGMFAEQLWLNLAPLYFDYIHIDRNLGANVAYWNLHEREISKIDGQYFINKDIPLVFFHFSGASDDAITSKSISSHQSEYDFGNRPDIKPLFEEYVQLLMRFNYAQNSGYYTVSEGFKTKNKFIIFAVTYLKKIIKRLPFKR